MISDVRSQLPGKCPGYERGSGIPVSFFLNRDDTVSAAIVGAQDGEQVRTLFSARRLDGQRRHCAPWDARDDRGRQLAGGVYRLRVTLEDADRVATAGERIRIRRARQRGLLP